MDGGRANIANCALCSDCGSPLSLLTHQLRRRRRQPAKLGEPVRHHDHAGARRCTGARSARPPVPRRADGWRGHRREAGPPRDGGPRPTAVGMGFVLATRPVANELADSAEFWHRRYHHTLPPQKRGSLSDQRADGRRGVPPPAQRRSPGSLSSRCKRAVASGMTTEQFPAALHAEVAQALLLRVVSRGCAGRRSPRGGEEGRVSPRA